MTEYVSRMRPLGSWLLDDGWHRSIAKKKSRQKRAAPYQLVEDFVRLVPSLSGILGDVVAEGVVKARLFAAVSKRPEIRRVWTQEIEDGQFLMTFESEKDGWAYRRELVEIMLKVCGAAVDHLQISVRPDSETTLPLNSEILYVRA